ncbi:hypothetical protein K505DRAFT_351282 [Melanomma pulvis-pyrius CBS 109.77]|uniref:DNA double-strand break repair and VJ recombination XRCC4 n=1 Tax=Melanomma pulvis-pyrius CBS 109.77 TaxID=1314802 RepID=A0A6A6X5F4_9PLEO|nr:hypothetical protein K505DRAFT_351282 [Melanomma pulvis-pyrius CBS 109.77]
MDARHIIPVPAANDGGEVVVVEVQQEGSLPLDVRLVGCEGENPYVTTIKQRNVGKLKNKFKGSDAEWEAILSHFLLQKQPEGDAAAILDGVRMVSSIKGESLEISIRKDVQGIKVTLGDILLPRDDEFEFNPFEWTQTSAQAHCLTLNEIGDLKTSLRSKQDTINKLNAQLEDFIKTKNEAETAMLQQFMALINEKKRKIRDQSRLLASAKVDKDTASVVQATREETKPRKAGPSRTSKRKVPVKAAKATKGKKAAAPEPESESDAMDVDDEPKVEEAEDDDSGAGAATPDRTSDDETEDEGNAPGSGPSSSRPQRRERSSETDKSNATVAQSSKDGPGHAVQPPPRRELPFGRANTRSKPLEKKASPPVADGDSETEDDDEL